MLREEGYRTGASLFLPALLVLTMTEAARGQGPAPETAPTLFPGGGLVSYASDFTARNQMPLTPAGIPATARPTFSHEALATFTWGFFRNFDLSVIVPVVTNRFSQAGARSSGGTGLGDALLLVKHRFYRRDSERGTTQASFTLGPKFPSGRTDLAASNAKLLPASLQPGSGSTGLFLAANWTYTGLFRLKRLVADEDFHALASATGAQSTRLGSAAESRFWLSYRPYQSSDGSREWFIGPVLTWLRSGDDRISGATVAHSGGSILLAGAAIYVGLRPGTHLRIAADWDAAHSAAGTFRPVQKRIVIGITQQFRMGTFR